MIWRTAVFTFDAYNSFPPSIQMIAITTVLIIRETLVEIRQMIIESTLESYEFIHSFNVFICVAEVVDTQWNWGHYDMR